MNNQENINYESSLLGLIIVDENAFHSTKGYLKPDDFVDKKNALIYQSISNVYDKGFESIELAPILEDLKRTGKLEGAGGLQYLSHLIQNPGLKSNLSKYIKQVSEESDLRKVKNQIKMLHNDLENNNSNSASDILEKVEIDILNTTRDSDVKQFKNSTQAIEETIKSIEERSRGNALSGTSVGFKSIDRMTGGFQKGDLIVLAARPSMGKTALALNMAANASLNSTVAFFSLEMPTEQLFNRIVSFTAFINQSKLRDSRFLSKSEWNKIYASKSKIERMKLFVDDTAGIKLSELVWKAKRLHKNASLDIIFIDYMQLITIAGSRGDNRQNEVSTISRTLKKLARDLNIPVVALSQLSRRVEQRENKIPMMSDLRESGAIEQDADIFSFLYRDSYYNRDDNEGANGKEESDIIIAKHRNGPTGDIKILFKPENGLFIEKGQ